MIFIGYILFFVDTFQAFNWLLYVQGFAKGLLDVADNLDRASSVVKESFAKLDTSSDSSGAVPLLKTLLEGVEMTEKQLAEVKSSCNQSK